MPIPFDLKSQLNLSDNPLVKCGCGRDVNADMMRDVTPVAQLLGESDSHICDSCLESHFRNRHLSYAQFYTAHGAPAAIVAIHSARDIALKAAR